MRALVVGTCVLGLCSAFACGRSEPVPDSDDSAVYNITLSAASQRRYFGDGTTHIFTATVRDVDGNLAETPQDITLAMGLDPNLGLGTSTTLSGTLTRTTVDGVAVFDDIEFGSPGYGFIMKATGDENTFRGLTYEFDIIARRVFVLWGFYNGDFEGLVDPYGTSCMWRAQHLVGPRGNSGWTSWLSLSYRDARDSVGDVGPWYRVDLKTLVAADLAELESGQLRNPIVTDQWGNRAGGLVYTGTNASGQATGNNCSDWSDVNGTATFGDPDAADSSWTDAEVDACDIGAASIYCFENTMPFPE